MYACMDQSNKNEEGRVVERYLDSSSELVSECVYSISMESNKNGSTTTIPTCTRKSRVFLVKNDQIE